MRTLIRVAMLLDLTYAAPWGVATGQGFGDIYAADPYAGKVSAQVFAPGGSHGPAKNEPGTAGARFVPIGTGRPRLEV